MSFQTQVYINPAQGQPGDFASSNPMFFQMSSSGKMVADSAGVTVGHFAIINDDGTVTSLPSSGLDVSRIGFVHREANAQIVTFLADHSYTIYAGLPVALFAKGDFFVTADVVNTASRGAAILWNITTGQTEVGGTPSLTLLDTGFKCVTATPVLASTIIISRSLTAS